MEKIKKKIPQKYVLIGVAYLTLTSVFIGSMVTLPDDASPLPVIGVFIGLVIVMAFQGVFERHKLQVVYLVVLTLMAASLYFFGVDPGVFLIIFFIISAQAMIYLMDWRGVLFIIGMAAISSLFFIFRFGFQAGLMVMFIYGGGYFFFGAVGRAMVRAQEAQKHSEQLYRELQAAHEQLQDYVYRVEELAVAQERNRLAREVHDSIGHRLTVSAVQLEGAQRLIPKDPDKAAEMVGTVREQVKQALSELRQTVATLREPVETGMSIDHALQRLVNSFEDATGLTVNLTIEQIPSLPDGHRAVLYRVAQEALTNVQRHAEASLVWLTLFTQGNSIRLLIGDNGIGFPGQTDDNSFGLRGIQERVGQLGGSSTFEERTGGGAQISITLPLPEGTRHE